MDCKIDIDGDLVVGVMSETEAFAIEKWKSFFMTGESALKLIVRPTGAPWDVGHFCVSHKKSIRR